MKTDSLIRLWNVTQQHRDTSGARACAGVLLGLYNGRRFPMNLIDLRCLDPDLTQHALLVIQADAMRCEYEVHEWLNRLAGRNDFGARFEHLATYWRRKGCCTRKELAESLPLANPWLIVSRQAAPLAEAA